MNLLLDTHIWLWSLLEPEKLTRKVSSALRSARNELWLSPISVWELMMLVERGRVKLDRDVDAWLAQATQHAPMREAPVTHEIARATGTLGLPHRDPVDRFLGATAKILDLTLVTADQRLANCREFRALQNG